MDNLQRMLRKEAYGFAVRNDIESAMKIVDTLKVLGMGDKEIEALRRHVIIDYLKRCKDPLKFGVVGLYALPTATVDADDESEDTQYIGLSPHAYHRFLVGTPIYYKEYVRKEVLFPLDAKWYYINLKDKPYGGLVVESWRGDCLVAPYFDLEQIKALAEKHIRNLGGVDSHAWEIPLNFTTSPAECEYVQRIQTKLACTHYGLPYASF